MEIRTVRPNPDNMGGSRPLSAITMILVHCTQGSTAAGAAAHWARPVVTPGTEGSAHVVFDDDLCIRAVDDDQVAYGARGYNFDGLHIEIAGFVQWTRIQWLERRPRLEAAAAFQAAAHRTYGVPFRESTTSGYHSHAGLPGNDHTDPGPNFPWDVYLSLVEAGVTGAAPIDRLTGGNTLRLVLRRVGAARPYVDAAGWPECLRPMQILADQGIRRPAEVEATFTWQGGVWRGGGRFGGDPREVLPRIRTVLNNYGP